MSQFSLIKKWRNAALWVTHSFAQQIFTKSLLWARHWQKLQFFISFQNLGCFFMLSISFIDKHLEGSSLCKMLGKMESMGGCRVRGQLRIRTLETGCLGVSLTFTFTVFLGDALEHLGPQSFYLCNGDNTTPSRRLVRIKCVNVCEALRSGTGHPSAV